MWSKIIRTDDDKVLTLLRLALGIVVFPHGAQKLLGWCTEDLATPAPWAS